MGAPRGAFHVGWEGEIPYDRPCTAKEKDPTAFLSHFFFPSSLRKNPAERMNYLELMVSAELFLLVFIPNFETQISGPAGKWDMWVIFQARSVMGVVCLRWKGVLISWVLRSGFPGVFSLSPVYSWRV